MILGRPHQQNDMQGIIVVKDTWPLKFILTDWKFHLQILWRISKEWVSMMMNKKHTKVLILKGFT
jgi:hypothetical protein